MPEKTKKTSRKKTTQRRFSILKEYFTDCSKPEMLYATLVRSPISGGKITNIIFSDLPEGYFFFSARDIPGINYIETMGVKTRVFCNEKVHYKGQPVGILVGPDLEKTKLLADSVQITFDITTVESELQEATWHYGKQPLAPDPDNMLPEEQQIANDSSIAEFVDLINILPDLDELPKNTKNSSYTEPSQIEKAARHINPRKHTERILAKRIVKSGFFKITDDIQIIEDEIKMCPYDIASQWVLDEVSPNWIEPTGALCFKDGSKFNVITTTQWPPYLAKNIAQVLNIEEEKINIQKTLSQTENTSGIWRNTTIAAQTAVASLLTGKPVKLVMTSEEQKQFLQPGLKTVTKLRTAIEADGTIKALIAEIDCDAGYSNPFAQEIADRIAVAACNFYNPRHVSIRVTVHSSENPPTSLYSQIVDSQVFFALENHLERISRKTNILPQELRLKNICTIERERKSPFAFTFSKPEETINAIIKQSDFSRKNSSFRLNALQNANGRTFFSLARRGIGLASAFNGDFFYGTKFPLDGTKIQVTLGEDGKLVINATCPSDSVISIWKQIANKILGIEPNQISVNQDFALTQEIFMPESFYSDISITALLLKRALETIKKRMEKESLPITVEKSLTPAMKKQWDSKKFSGKPYQTSAFGVAAVEVELNANTYQEIIKGIWVAVDCGEILSIKAAESAVRLAIQQELERLVQDSSVQCEGIHISFVASKQTPCQIGHLIHNLIPAAFSSALSMALSKSVTHIPCTKQELFELSTMESPKIQEAASYTEDSEDKSNSEEVPAQDKEQEQKENVE